MNTGRVDEAVQGKLLTHGTARFLGVTPDAVRAMNRRGVLSAVRVGGVRLFDKTEVQALARERARRVRGAQKREDR